MKYLIFALAMVFTSPALALCASAISQDADGITVKLSGNERTFLFADLANGSTAKRAADLEEQMQDWIDVREPLASIPTDDPDKSVDPFFATIFWADIDGKRRILLSSNDYLVSRSADVTIIVTGSGKNDFIPSFAEPSAPPVIE